MLDGSDGIARTFDDDVDLGEADQGGPVVGDPGRARAQGLLGRGRLRLFRLPPYAGQVGPCRVRRQIGDGDQVDPWRARNLRKIHGPEFTRSDQAYPYRSVLGGALLQLCVKTHGSSLAEAALRLGRTPWFDFFLPLAWTLMAGSGEPDQVRRYAASRRTLLTRAGRKQARLMPPTRRTLGYTTPSDPFSRSNS